MAVSGWDKRRNEVRTCQLCKQHLFVSALNERPAAASCFSLQQAASNMPVYAQYSHAGVHMQAGNAWAKTLFEKGIDCGIPSNGAFTQAKCYQALRNRWKNCLKEDRQAAGKTTKGGPPSEPSYKLASYLQAGEHGIMRG